MGENSDQGPTRACLTCRFSVLEQTDPKIIQRQLICHLMPPTVTLIPTPQGLMAMTGFPQVLPTHWCYQWQPQPVINDGIVEGTQKVSL